MSAMITAPKACEGGAITKLAPMRMADAAQQPATPLSSTRTATGYVPPSMRAKTSDKPITMPISINTASKDEFPTLGAAPKPIAGSASWTQIRSRFQPAPEPVAAAPPTKASSSTNIFAGLDDPDVETPSPSKGVNFKQVIKDRIKREAEERLGIHQDVPTDPQLMTREQLEQNGWAVLSRPPAEHGPERTAWFAEYVARNDAKEAARDKELETLYEILGPAVTHNPLSRGNRPPAPSVEDAFDDDADNTAFDDAVDNEPCTEDYDSD